jgi:hypothetical protein
MRRFRMVVVQVRSQMVSNYNFVSHSRFEKALLHLARQVRPQCERGLAQQAFKFVSRVIHHRQTSLFKKAVEAQVRNVVTAETSYTGAPPLIAVILFPVNELSMNFAP